MCPHGAVSEPHLSGNRAALQRAHVHLKRALSGPLEVFTMVPCRAARLPFRYRSNAAQERGYAQGDKA
eukprot:4731538-Alexandrium_andersonii.AAC.1